MKTTLDLAFLENSTETLRSIAHPIRIEVIEMLHRNGKMTVTEIYEQLQIEQAVASHHLKIMKNKAIVKVERDGRNSLYSLTTPEFYHIVDILTKVL
ncbi:MAG: metalloregulator ArsR/SmtB family transcription factor [Bacteroidota bacterium]